MPGTAIGDVLVCYVVPGTAIDLSWRFDRYLTDRHRRCNVIRETDRDDAVRCPVLRGCRPRPVLTWHTVLAGRVAGYGSPTRYRATAPVGGERRSSKSEGGRGSSVERGAAAGRRQGGGRRRKGRAVT
eukprot:2069423-Rhodomonas_salina.4